jgi:hypothetical protein
LLYDCLVVKERTGRPFGALELIKIILEHKMSLRV